MSATKTGQATRSESSFDRTPLDDILLACGLKALGENPPLDAVEVGLRALAQAMSGEDRGRKRLLVEGAIGLLKKAKVSGGRDIVTNFLTGTEVDRGSERQGAGLDLEDPVRWPEAVDAADLLGELARTFTRFIALPPGGATVLALWTLHSHSHDGADISPVLNITSPMKGCGKTTLLAVLGALVPRPLHASNLTPAVVFRSIEHFRPTLLIDEADTFMDSDELRGILNSGHTRNGIVLRIVGDEHEPRAFSTWTPKAVAGIGKRAATLEDRSITVQLRRKTRNEATERVRFDRLGSLDPLRRQAWTWAQDNLNELRESDPIVPELRSDRAADNWRPLLAIADMAGGPWPDQARKAALLFSGADVEDDSASVLLLGDLRDLLRESPLERLGSADIVSRLILMEERPWPEWKRGQPMTTRQLAGLLNPFDIHPQTIRIGDGTAKGYKGEDLQDAFERYLPPTAPFSSVTPSQPFDGKGFSAISIRHTTDHVTDTRSGEKPRPASIVTDVTDRNGGKGQSETLEAEVPNLFSDEEVTV